MKIIHEYPLPPVPRKHIPNAQDILNAFRQTLSLYVDNPHYKSLDQIYDALFSDSKFMSDVKDKFGIQSPLSAALRFTVPVYLVEKYNIGERLLSLDTKPKKPQNTRTALIASIREESVRDADILATAQYLTLDTARLDALEKRAEKIKYFPNAGENNPKQKEALKKAFFSFHLKPKGQKYPAPYNERLGQYYADVTTIITEPENVLLFAKANFNLLVPPSDNTDRDKYYQPPAQQDDIASHIKVAAMRKRGYIKKLYAQKAVSFDPSLSVNEIIARKPYTRKIIASAPVPVQRHGKNIIFFHPDDNRKSSLPAFKTLLDMKNSGKQATQKIKRLNKIQKLQIAELNDIFSKLDDTVKQKFVESQLLQKKL